MDIGLKKPEPPPRPPAVRTVPKRRGEFLPLFAGVALALALGVGAVSGWLLSRGKAEAQLGDQTWRLGTLVVNVANTDGRRYLKGTLEFSLAPGQSRKPLEDLRPHLTDLSLGVLAEASLGELLDAGQRDQLKQRLLGRLNAELKGAVLKQVYFTEFVIQ
jgi:flagellar basal body-associated protein FliL